MYGQDALLPPYLESKILHMLVDEGDYMLNRLNQLVETEEIRRNTFIALTDNAIKTTQEYNKRAKGT